MRGDVVCVECMSVLLCVWMCGVEESAYEAMHEMHALLMDEVVFGDDSNWDKEIKFDYEGAHFVKKCKHFLGINWCYCKSNEMILPIPCFGAISKHKHSVHENHKRASGDASQCPYASAICALFKVYCWCILLSSHLIAMWLIAI